MNPALQFPIENDWSCKRSGDCCTQPSHVVMSEPERDLLLAWARAHWTIGQLNRLVFEPLPLQEGFVQLVAKPCPFYEPQGKTCTVRSIRPYNCRRFACLRPDPESEPLRFGTLPAYVPYPDLTVVNLRMRVIQSGKMRRLYARIQRKAQIWARNHGWSPSVTGYSEAR